MPKGWEWCRLRDIILGTNAGKSPNCEKRPKKSEEWGVLTTTSIQENAFLSNENKVLPKHYVITPEHCVRYGDILITRAGPVNRTGIVCMVENNCDKLILSDKTVRIDYMHDYCNPKFLVFVLNSSAIHELVMSATVGMAASQVNVSQGSIQNTLIPFPPSKEQQRIINKLEALLPQIEKYNNAQNKLDELNKTVKGIIKKSVLQEAIQGKLVSQLEEEGTAKELLGQIKAEKQRLVKDGKLKKSALNDSVIFKGDDNKYYEQIGSEVSEIELPFDFPSTWSMARLNAVCQLTDGLKTIGKQCLLDAKYLRGKSSETIVEQGKLVYKGDNIMLVDGENSGEVFIVPQDGYMGSTFKQLWISSSMYEPYVLAFIQLYKETLRNSKKGAAIPHLNKELFYGLIIGIPSLQEQRRIVQKIEQLMQLLK